MSNLEQILENGTYALIDVREPMELDMDGAIASAKNIPLGEIENHVDEILALSTPVVLFCRSGNRSGKALEYLQSKGLKNGYNGGGYADLSEKIK